MVKYVNPIKDDPNNLYIKKEDTQVNFGEPSTIEEERKPIRVKHFIELSINTRKIFVDYLEIGILRITHGK